MGCLLLWVFPALLSRAYRCRPTWETSQTAFTFDGEHRIPGAVWIGRRSLFISASPGSYPWPGSTTARSTEFRKLERWPSCLGYEQKIRVRKKVDQQDRPIRSVAGNYSSVSKREERWKIRAFDGRESDHDRQVTESSK